MTQGIDLRHQHCHPCAMGWLWLVVIVLLVALFLYRADRRAKRLGRRFRSDNEIGRDVERNFREGTYGN
jgi:biopolymer transport protein ExbB/TolQ